MIRVVVSAGVVIRDLIAFRGITRQLAENIVDNSAELRERLEEKSSEFADLTNEDAKIIVSML
jgi:hypothetical protein